MKKIFAFILATIMVLSLVPASAFAAITKDEPCPVTHTISNCEAVIVDTVDADCENPGFTRFQCTKCGVQFVGNIVAAGEHKWVLDEEHEKTKLPACTENKPGFGHFDCSICGEEKEVEIPVADLHVLEYVTGVGCEAAYKCTVCEGTFNSKGGEVGEHEGWELTEVISEPTAKATGLALFTCTAKKCGATKEVTINKQCGCRTYLNTQAKFYNWYAAGKLVLKTKPSKVSCTKDGKYAIYACADCGTFYRWKTSDKTKSTDLPVAVENEDGQVTGIKNGSFGYVAKNENKTSSYKINKLGHSYVADNDKDHPVKIVDACNYSKYCKTCKTYVAQDGHTWYNVSSTKATCETYGITYKVCQVCGSNKNEVTDPYQHDIKTYTYESTCGKYGYVVSYCANNDKCNYYVAGSTGKNYFNISTGKTYEDVTVDHDNKSSTAKVYRPIINITDLTTLKGTHTLVSTPLIGGSSSNSCQGGGIVMQQCTQCNYYTYAQVPGKAHTYGEAVTIPATCTSAGSTTKTCKVCGYIDVVMLPPLTAHKFVDVTVVYKCFDATGAYEIGYDGRPYHGYKIMACEFGCAGTEVKQYIDAVGSSSPKAWFESYAEAVVYHGANLVRNNYRQPTCTSAGYGIYTCATCNKNVYITEPAASHIPTLGSDLLPLTIPAKPATCVTTGTKAYQVCSICQSFIVLNEKNEYVAISPAEIVTQPHSATVSPVVISSCDGVNTVTYWVCTVEGCGKIFADQACTTPVAKLPADKAHSWKIIDAGVVLNCNNDGYPEIRYCATCKTLERTQYAQFVVDGEVVVDVYGDVVTKVVEEYEIPYELGYVNGNYNKAAYKVAKYSHGEAEDCPAEWAGKLMVIGNTGTANCDDEYGYVDHICLVCGYEYITDFVPAAGGHVNVYGEKLEESCANYVAVADRHCVNCDKSIGTDKSLHNVVEGSTIPATCVTEGYTYDYCKNEGCTWYAIDDVTPIIKASTFHKNAANLTTTQAWDYANNGDSITSCKYCGTVVKVTESKDYNLEAGIEFNMATEYDHYMPNSYIDVVVSLDSLKGVDVWGLSFSVKYDPEVVEFVSADFAGLFAGNNTANAVTGVKYVANPEWDRFTNPFVAPMIPDSKGTIVPYGIVTVASDNGASGTKIVGENEYVVLTFKVIASNTQAVFTLGEVATDYPYQSYSLKVVGPNGKEVKTNYGVSAKELWLNLDTFLDLDADGEVTILDAFEMYYLILNDEYNVLADADHDNDVDTDDLDLLYKVLVGETTLEEILNPKETEATGDLNGDGIIGEGETDEEGRAPGTDNGKAHPSLPSSPEYQG